MEQLNEQDIKERLGQLMLAVWQLDKMLASLRAENAALKVKYESKPEVADAAE